MKKVVELQAQTYRRCRYIHPASEYLEAMQNKLRERTCDQLRFFFGKSTFDTSGGSSRLAFVHLLSVSNCNGDKLTEARRCRQSHGNTAKNVFVNCKSETKKQRLRARMLKIDAFGRWECTCMCMNGGDKSCDKI